MHTRVFHMWHESCTGPWILLFWTSVSSLRMSGCSVSLLVAFPSWPQVLQISYPPPTKQEGNRNWLLINGLSPIVKVENCPVNTPSPLPTPLIHTRLALSHLLATQTLLEDQESEKKTCSFLSQRWEGRRLASAIIFYLGSSFPVSATYISKGSFQEPIPKYHFQE